MTLQIKVYSDYVCPFCFVGKAAFEEAIKDKDVQVEWMPFELRPSPSPKLDPVNDPAKRQMWKNSIEPMAQSLGVEITFPVCHRILTRIWHLKAFISQRNMGKEANTIHAFFRRSFKKNKISVTLAC